MASRHDRVVTLTTSTQSSDPAMDDDWDAFLSAMIKRCAIDAGEPKQDRSRRRRQDILRAASRVFARDGISKTRIGDIASEAGMPVSSIYEYFSSKEDLAYAGPAIHLALFYAEYAEAVINTKTARERLRLYLLLAADVTRRNPDWARTLYLEIWPSILVNEARVRQSLDDFVRVIVHLIKQGERRGEWPSGPSPYETAAILNGSVNQVIVTWLLYGKPRDLMTAVASVLDRLMAALLVEPNATSTPIAHGASIGSTDP